MDPIHSPTGHGGAERAERLLAELAAPDEPAGVAITFARIIIGLFPPWFDFAPAHFAVIGDGNRGLRLVVSGSVPHDFAVFPTSASRNMTCDYYRWTDAQKPEHGLMSMHYQPHPDHLERARSVIEVALHALFPERGRAPVLAGLEVPEGRIFPVAWE